MQINVKKLIPILLAVAAVFLIGGILILALLTGQATSDVTLALTVMIGILCILLAGVILFVVYTTFDNDPNFFLYDSKLKKNISLEELTFERVNSRMGYYMSLISSSQVPSPMGFSGWDSRSQLLKSPTRCSAFAAGAHSR